MNSLSIKSVRVPAGARMARCAKPLRVVVARAEAEDKNPLEKAGDAIKEKAQEFADAQKMPDLSTEDDDLTKDGAFYTVSNKNPVEEDKGIRAGVGSGKTPDVPFSENQSKGENPGSDSTKPSVPDNVDKAVSGN